MGQAHSYELSVRHAPAMTPLTWVRLRRRLLFRGVDVLREGPTAVGRGGDFPSQPAEHQVFKERFALAGSAPVARIGSPIEDRHRQTVETLCQQGYSTVVQFGFQGW